MPTPEVFSTAIRRLPAGEVIRLVSGGGNAPSSEELMQFRFRPGDRVVVLDTGEECEVIRGRRFNVVVPAAQG